MGRWSRRASTQAERSCITRRSSVAGPGALPPGLPFLTPRPPVLEPPLARPGSRTAPPAGSAEGNTTWRSPQLLYAQEQFPLRFRLVANGHRSSPNTRPLIWDSSSRVLYAPPEDGVYCCEFEPTVCAQGGGCSLH